MITKEFLITKDQYERALSVVKAYKKQEAIKGKSICPFCRGSKITPFVSSSSQNCNSCDQDGMIENRVLYSVDLESEIQKPTL